LVAAGTTSTELASFRSALRRAVRRHPAEPYFPLLGAYAASASKQDPLPWLAHALERGPRYGQVHLALADFMRARGAGLQGYMHVRLAAHYDVNLEEEVMARALRWSRSFEELARGFPNGAEGSGLLVKLCGRVNPAWATACWRESVTRDPGNAAARLAFAQTLVDSLESAQPPCDGVRTRACAVEAAAAVRGVTEREHGWRALLLRSRLQAYGGDRRGAAEALLERCPSMDEAAACLRLALDLAGGTRDADFVLRVAERFTAARCSASKACAAAHERVGAILADLGSWPRALEHQVAAAKADPTAERWVKVAEGAVRADAPTVAQTALLRAEVLRRTARNVDQ